MVVAQEPTQPLAAANASAPGRVRVWRDQRVPEPLMISVSVIVRHVLVERAKQPTLAEENQAVETLLAD